VPLNRPGRALRPAAVYFCCIEALQNIAKYAAASRAAITLRAASGTLTFSVADDGAGFDAARTALGAGLGNMSDRLSALGGRLEVTSAPGRGTTITGRLPVAAAGPPPAAPGPRPASAALARG
jgi:signal transduction histidine kinase